MSPASKRLFCLKLRGYLLKKKSIKSLGLFHRGEEDKTISIKPQVLRGGYINIGV